MLITLLVACLALSTSLVSSLSCNTDANDVVSKVPGSLNTNLQIPSCQYSGYVDISDGSGSLFYWFFEAAYPESPPDEDTPIIVWLDGGPGVSSMTGVFYESGLYNLSQNGEITLKDASQTWNAQFHVLFVDQPIGTGYSVVSNPNAYVSNEDKVGSDMVELLNGFFLRIHPEYKENPFYLTGSSYGGRYVPFIAKHVILDGALLANMQKGGAVIGNGLYDPLIQFPASPTYAYMHGILSTSELDFYVSAMNECLAWNDSSWQNNPYAGNCTSASIRCQSLSNEIFTREGGDVFQYDIRQPNGSYFNGLSDALNSFAMQGDVKTTINVPSDVVFVNSDGTAVPNPVAVALTCDILLNDSAPLFPLMIENGIRIMFFNGMMDASICTNYGNTMCLDQWNYRGTWIDEAKKRPVFGTGNSVIGYLKQSADEMLTYFVVANSGHLVEINQPGVGTTMITSFINNDWPY